jgi:hypothetical protein
LVKQGRGGGLEAARVLTDALKAQLDGVTGYQLWTYCFLNKPGLAMALGIKSSIFDSFIAGFNSSGERAFMIDVGSGKEAADSRIRGELSSLPFSTTC